MTDADDVNLVVTV